MTPAELRELADKVEVEALNLATGAVDAPTPWHASRSAKCANRLFLMARNLRERASELDKEEMREAFRRARPEPGDFVKL